MRIASIHRFRLPAAAFAASLLAPAVARSDDFTFTVPVDVRSLPSAVHGAGVRCEVRKTVPPVTSAFGDGRSSSGEARFPLTNGGFQGNVTVRFNATEVSPSEAKGYRCSLYYIDVAGKEESFSMGNWSVGHRPGTPFTPEVRGAINP